MVQQVGQVMYPVMGLVAWVFLSTAVLSRCRHAPSLWGLLCAANILSGVPGETQEKTSVLLLWARGVEFELGKTREVKSGIGISVYCPKRLHLD